jgi:tetratricopeptide (TPR) repeat protein
LYVTLVMLSWSFQQFLNPSLSLGRSAMRRSPIGKPIPAAVLLLACCVAVGGCRDEGGGVDSDPNESVGRADAVADNPQSLADLDAIVESNRPDEGSALQEQAFQLVREGDTLGAERLMLDRVAKADEQFGQGSAQLAWAQFDLATIYLAVGEMPKAIGALREACKIDVPGDTQAAKDRLTFMMNLGEVLEVSGQLDEAEKVLRDGLAQREDLYGREHPGYAYGLEPLATVLLRQGELQEALELADDAVDNYAQNSHPAVVTAMALRAEIIKTAGSQRPAFDGQQTLTDTSFEDLTSSVVNRLSLDNAEVGRRLLDDLIPISTSRLGEHHEQTITLLIALSNMHRVLGNHEERIQTFRQLLEAFEARGEPAQAIESLKGLAMAQADAGKEAEADQAYALALQRAKDIGDPVLESDDCRGCCRAAGRGRRSVGGGRYYPRTDDRRASRVGPDHRPRAGKFSHRGRTGYVFASVPTAAGEVGT